jgi:mRNA-degrading endonuclease toxin of MazEF toxin-antitoxin module
MESIQVVLDLSFRRPLTPRPKRQEVNRSELVRRALREHLRALRVADLQECDRRGYQAQSAAGNRGVQRVGEGGRMAGRLNRGDVHVCRFASPDKQSPVLTRDSAHLDSPQCAVGGPLGCRGRNEEPVALSQERLGRRRASLSNERMQDVCAALRLTLGCGRVRRHLEAEPRSMTGTSRRVSLN